MSEEGRRCERGCVRRGGGGKGRGRFKYFNNFIVPVNTATWSSQQLTCS